MTVALTTAAAVIPGRDVPGAVLSNAELATLHADLVARLAALGRETPAVCDPDFPWSRAGVAERPVLDRGWSVRDLAVAAGRAVVARARLDVERVAAVVVTSTAPADPIPSLASTVHGALGLAAHVPALDVSVGCTGFVAAVDVAARLLAAAPHGACAIVIGAEAMLRVVDAADRATAVLFGDAAGAVVLERDDDARPPRTSWTTLGGQWADIRIAPRDPDGPVHRFVADAGALRVVRDESSRLCLTMRGQAVFRDVVRVVPDAILDHLATAGVPSASIALFALHQANARMLAAIRRDERLACDATRLPIRVAELGNTSSASVPVVLAGALDDGHLRAGDRLALVGFGAGLAVAVTTIDLKT